MLIAIYCAESARSTPRTGFSAFSNTDQAATTSSVRETPQDASTIIPDFDEIRSLAEREEMFVSEVIVMPIGDVTALICSTKICVEVCSSTGTKATEVSDSERALATMAAAVC
jgi:hypothetical protein